MGRRNKNLAVNKERNKLTMAQRLETDAQFLNVCSATQSLLITLGKEVQSGLSQTINSTDDTKGTTPQQRFREAVSVVMILW